MSAQIVHVDAQSKSGGKLVFNAASCSPCGIVNVASVHASSRVSNRSDNPGTAEENFSRCAQQSATCDMKNRTSEVGECVHTMSAARDVCGTGVAHFHYGSENIPGIRGKGSIDSAQSDAA